MCPALFACYKLPEVPGSNARSAAIRRGPVRKSLLAIVVAVVVALPALIEVIPIVEERFKRALKGNSGGVAATDRAPQPVGALARALQSLNESPEVPAPTAKGTSTRGGQAPIAPAQTRF